MARTMSDEQERDIRRLVDLFDETPSDSNEAALLAELDAERAAHEETKARLALAEKWAAFGSDCFDGFWYDGEPSDLDAGDMQELALSHGLLRHRTEGDNTLDPDADSCCEHCPCVTEDAPPSECECLFPTLAPWRAAK